VAEPRIELLKRDLFIDSPGDLLVGEVVKELLKVPEFKTVFGEFIDDYKRMDYGFSNLPALRIYSDTYEKPDEDWFITGDLKADVILPVSLRRNELQVVQDVISSALMQQFRRPSFFSTLSDKVPGLNELGRRFSVDKSLGFEMEDNEVPLTQIIINFKLDLRQWDLYLENTFRTKDEPFEKSLANLLRIKNVIEGLLSDNETVEVTEKQDVNLEDLNG
jgi:hypothetical protein